MSADIERPHDLESLKHRKDLVVELESSSARLPTEIAAMGSPPVSRAVSLALAANPIALAIPCHRVIRSNGDLSGYRWGVERKRMLLDSEAAA